MPIPERRLLSKLSNKLLEAFFRRSITGDCQYWYVVALAYSAIRACFFVRGRAEYVLDNHGHRPSLVSPERHLSRNFAMDEEGPPSTT